MSDPINDAKLTRWAVEMGKGIKTLKVYPLTETPQQAEERAIIVWPGWTVIGISKHVESNVAWKIW